MRISAIRARDHRIDILRGLALISIFINHVPGNVLEPFTHKNFGLTDSAETFVLLAGVAAAFAYFPRFSAGDRLLAVMKAVKRAGTLYVAHLASIVVGLAVFSAAAVSYGETGLLEEINIAPFFADPVKGMVGLATMSHQIGYHNILPMYVCLLLLLPVLMGLASRSLGLMLAASVTLYLSANSFGWTLPSYPAPGGWYFNPFTWQLIFAVGFFTGVRVLGGRTPVPYVPMLWWACVAYLVAACVYHRFNLYGLMPHLPLVPETMQMNEKPWVALGRLTHILSLAYVIGHSPAMRALGRLSPSHPLALIGRHALVVFWLGTMLSMVGQVVMRVGKPEAAMQVLLLAAGIGIQIAVAWSLDWAARAEKHRQSAAISAPKPAEAESATVMPAVMPALWTDAAKAAG